MPTAETYYPGDEPIDPVAAGAAYRRALSADLAFLDAYLNLGAFLCELDRASEAVELYESAMAQWPQSAYLLFNYAIALENQGRLADAVKAYERFLGTDPGFADAHYNLGILLARSVKEKARCRTSAPTGD